MRAILLLALTLITLTACSGEYIYNIGQEWQRRECMKIEDAGERSKCMDDARTPYQEYKQQ